MLSGGEVYSLLALPYFLLYACTYLSAVVIVGTCSMYCMYSMYSMYVFNMYVCTYVRICTTLCCTWYLVPGTWYSVPST